MHRLTLLASCCVVAVAAAALSSDDEQSAKSPMLSQLAVGQRVKLERATSGGYNVIILNDRYIQSYERADAQYVVQQIIEVGPDFIVVDVPRRFKQTISAHAIDVITQLPDSDEADDENG